MSMNYTPEQIQAIAEKSVPDLLELLQQEARQRHNGHFTILSLGDYYLAGFGVPTYSKTHKIKGKQTLREALVTALLEDHTFNWLDP